MKKSSFPTILFFIALSMLVMTLIKYRAENQLLTDQIHGVMHDWRSAAAQALASNGMFSPADDIDGLFPQDLKKLENLNGDHKSKPSVISGKTGFNFFEVCKAHSLNPDKTSKFEALCLYWNLDPNKTSEFELECKQFGLDPDTTSMFVLKCKKYGLPVVTTTLQDLDGKM